MEKKTYRVWAIASTHCYIDIEAEDEDKAKDIANDADGGDFVSTAYGDWEITDAIELTPQTDGNSN